jgi:acyl-CoA synthetase (AMP-forming)/AMP-acid ligase II
LASVGRPVDGLDLRIDRPDRHGVGEVWARAPHLFVADDDGWLHTGDVGRVDDEGYLYLVGRRGDTIIRGGENVHPLEIERVLESHVAVREAAVVGVPDRRWGEVVHAFVVPVDAAAPPAPDDLRTFARSRLAGFKVPVGWTVVAELPRNASGKLLRRALGVPA